MSDENHCQVYIHIDIPWDSSTALPHFRLKKAIDRHELAVIQQQQPRIVHNRNSCNELAAQDLEEAGNVHSLHRSFSASSDCLNRTRGCGRQVVIVACWWKLARR